MLERFLPECERPVEQRTLLFYVLGERRQVVICHGEVAFELRLGRLAFDQVLLDFQALEVGLASEGFVTQALDQKIRKTSVERGQATDEPGVARVLTDGFLAGLDSALVV